MDDSKKNRKRNIHQKGDEEVLPKLTRSEALTSHAPSTGKESDKEMGEHAIDVTAGEEWVARVELARQVVEFLGRRMNVADCKFKTLEEIENIRKEL